MEALLSKKTVAELVADNYRTAEVFKKHGIDFCCGGKKPVEQVCREKQIDEIILEQELLEVQTQPVDLQYDFKNWSLNFLIDYIVQIHHRYINNNIELITGFAEKVAKVHGHHNTETVEISALWKKVAEDLTVHMKKEELILFPYIKNLEKYSRHELKTLPHSHFGTVKNPVRMMEQEHDEAGDLMHSIRHLSNNFTPPEYACNTYKVLYAKLNEFEDNLHQHVHIENNVLFPEAIQLEVDISKFP